MSRAGYFADQLAPDRACEIFKAGRREHEGARAADDRR
jgi:hypothetical protein